MAALAASSRSRTSGSCCLIEKCYRNSAAQSLLPDPVMKFENLANVIREARRNASVDTMPCAVLACSLLLIPAVVRPITVT